MMAVVFECALVYVVLVVPRPVRVRPPSTVPPGDAPAAEPEPALVGAR